PLRNAGDAAMQLSNRRAVLGIFVADTSVRALKKRSGANKRKIKQNIQSKKNLHFVCFGLQMFSGLIDMVAVRDVNPDPMFKCLTARRIQFDAEAPSATYLWFLHAAEDKETERVAFHFTPGNTSGTTRAIVDSDTSHPVVARFPYTDYSSCGVLEQNYFGYQCTLWVSDEAKDSISPECLRQYEDICGESVSLYDKNICDKAQE
ncbi:hypothetical protein V5799_017808, partial [Amblyomma americanum]